MRKVQEQSTVKTGRQELNNHDRPVWRKSFTTSCRRDVTINTSSVFQLQQGGSESTGNCAAQDGTPSHPPRLFGVSQGWVAQTQPSPWPRGTRTLVSPPTNGLRSLLPKRRGEPCDVGPPTQGTSARSIVWLPSKQHHPHLPRVDEGTRRNAKEKPASCRLPAALLQRAAAHQPRFPICADHWG